MEGRALLEEPFRTDLIRTRSLENGVQLRYVEGAEYIRRLNEAFKGDWSFEIVDYRVLDNEVIVRGLLRAEGIEKSAFGGSRVTKSQKTGQPVSIADDLKAAATDALKKACTLLGIGLHLYERSEGSHSVMVPRGMDRPRGLDPATYRQLAAIRTIAQQMGWADDHLESRSMADYGVPVDNLSKIDASRFIGALNRECADGRKVLHG
jgi:hypothetical protein